MSFLMKKMFRNVVKNWTQFIAVFFMAFLCMLVYSGLEGTWCGMKKELNDYIDKQNLADEWVYATAFEDGDIDKFEQIEGVDKVALKTRISVLAEYKDDDAGYLSLESLKKDDITKPYIIKGKDSDEIKYDEIKDDEILLDNTYAEEFGIKIGDRIKISLNGKETELTVRDLILLPNKISYTGTQEFLAPDPKLYGYGMINEETITKKLLYPYGGNYIEIKSNNSDVRDNTSKILKERYVAYYNRDTLPEVSNALSRVNQIRRLSLMFSSLFVLLSILSMNTTIKRLIDSQASDIATLKALGYSNRLLGWHYASYGLLIGAVGTIGGLCVSPLFSTFVEESQKIPYKIPHWSVEHTWLTPTVAIILVIICTLTAFLSSARVRHGLPSVAMQNVMKKGHSGIIEKVDLLWKGIGFGDRWTMRDALSHKLRIIMGIVSVCGTIMALMAGFGAPDAVKSLITKTFTKDFSYEYRVKINQLNDEQANEDLHKELDGQWIQTMPVRITPDDGYDRILTIFSKGDFINLKDSNGKKITDKGAYVTEGTAEMLNVKVGDTIKIETSLDVNKYECKVIGIIPSSTPQGIYLTEKAWEDKGGTFAPTHMMVGDKFTLDELENDDRITQVLSIEQQVDNIAKFQKAMNGIFVLMRSFAIMLSIIVLYNLGTLGFTERRKDYTTLRVLGLHNGEIRRMAVTENFVTTLIGFGIGIPAGFWFLDIYCQTFSSYSMKFYPNITTKSVIMVYSLTLVSAIITNLIMSRKIRKIDMVEAMKGVE
jgi:putative ABC transport system permease protein